MRETEDDCKREKARKKTSCKRIWEWENKLHLLSYLYQIGSSQRFYFVLKTLSNCQFVCMDLIEVISCDESSGHYISTLLLTWPPACQSSMVTLFVILVLIRYVMVSCTSLFLLIKQVTSLLRCATSLKKLS